MWVRLGLVAARLLLRVGIRLAPFLAVGLTALFRRYRWPLYYRAAALKPSRFSLAAIPTILLSLLGTMVLLAVALYLLVTRLTP